MSKAPLLILALRKTSPSIRYKVLIWILTFFVYTSYHLSRKPITVVKNALHSNCKFANATALPSTNKTRIDKLLVNNSCDYSWKPFDDAHPYEDYFGALDVSYLAGYAVGMFISGHIAERINLRYFLSGGMILSGLMTMAFGFGYLWNIHSLAYYIIVQIICGLFQSTGWPGVVACMGNWFGKGRRGLIMGIWNAHTSLGNILGGLIASAFLTKYWMMHSYWWWSFFYPGLIIMCMGVIVFFLLIPDPEDVGLGNTDQSRSEAAHSGGGESAPLINDTESTVSEYGAIEPSLPTAKTDNEEMHIDSLSDTHEISRIGTDSKPHAVSFIGALKVPGVVEFSLCLFFAKLVSYTFLYWLPQYIKQEMTGHVSMTDPDATAGDLATIVDVGGIFGAIFAGFLADATQSSAITCAIMLILSIPMMLLYRVYGALTYANAVGLLLATGFMVNGPYCLITTSVSADLGTHPSLATSAKALATVTAIIDGTGSIGAALGPGISAMVDGLKDQPLQYRMNLVFGMLIGSNVCALLFLSRLIYKEVQAIRERYYARRAIY